MRAVRPLVLFGVGGAVYVIIEVLWRGRSHWTMFAVGGMCFVLVGLINELFTFEMPLVHQMALGACIITCVEFMSGCVINLWLGWNVWDYSDMPFNVYGQICLTYVGLWFLLSAPAIILDDYLRHWLFGEEKPKYKVL